MISRISFFVFLCVYCTKADPEFRYDYKYYKEANGWLKLHFGPMHWDAAKYQCYYEGAVLASPLNKQLQTGISKLLQDQLSCPDVMFSGVSALIAEGIYTSVEGVPLERMPISWSRDEPSLSDGCLVFYSDGTMATKSCREIHPFVCYKKFEDLVINECGTVDNEYKRFDNKSTKCYKYHSQLEDWKTAFKICRAEGGHLITTINALDENYFRQHSISTIAVGYRTIDGVWWDIHGNLMVPIKYGANYSTCGGLKYDGSVTQISCEDSFHFGCEKSVDSLLPTELELN